MSKIISLIINSDSKKVWVSTSLTKFSWDILIEFFYQKKSTFNEQNGWKKIERIKKKKEKYKTSLTKLVLC